MEANDPTAGLAELLGWCLRQSNPLNAFNDVVLGRGAYWAAQRRICRALWDPSVTTVVVPAGHSVGKSYLAAGVLLGWLTLQRDSLVISTSPSNTQLSGVLWKEIARARNGSPIMRRIGRVTKLPNKFDMGDGWQALGFSTNKAERLQGFHAAGGPLLNIVDEASGIEDLDIWATLKSLKPRKTLLISNPLKAHGYFYDQCRRAESEPGIRLIRIPSTDSPDIGLEESPRGLADAAWLREMTADYGADSQTFRVRVRALFPDDSSDALVPSAWLDRAGAAVHQPGGHRRISVDLGLGNGGDDTVILVRDDNGIIYFEASNALSLEAAASRVAQLAQRFNVIPSRITWDFEGIGVDFSNRLRQVGLVGCMPYRGRTPSRGVKFNNLRSACHWLMRRRLNPDHRDEWNRELPPFAIPPEFLGRLRKELREITYTDDSKARTCVRPGEEVRDALRSSPDFTDTFAQSFAYPRS